MRRIRKTPEPRTLGEWRARSQSDLNFGYSLLPAEVRDVVVESLVSEQGWLCAYTGCRIDQSRCHVEHVKAQAHCQHGEDVAYDNLVACHPAPNTGEAAYGAHPKRDWPPPQEKYLFVSPLDDGCEERFQFNLRGEIQPADPNDAAAVTTIRKLRLDHPELTKLRKEAIGATLERSSLPSVADARRRLAQLERSLPSGIQLDPYCFALKQALRKHITRIESIRQSKKHPKP